MRQYTAEERRRRTLEAIRSSRQRTESVVEKIGLIVREPFAVGSKSERDAIMLRAPDRAWVLRRESQSVWDDDPMLTELIGRQVRVRGVVSGSTLVVRDVEGFPLPRSSK